MQILKRAKGDSGETVSFRAKEEDLRDEVNRRTAKAGYTTKYGEPAGTAKIMSRGIGESKLNVWPRDKNGQLIDD